MRISKRAVVVLIALAAGTAGCWRQQSVVARSWQTSPATQPVSANFPERAVPDAIPAVREGYAELGVCFSGGGTRSAAATLGQLRGLRHLKLLDRVQYISAVSGGAWAATPYTFLPLKCRDKRDADADAAEVADAADAHFLGCYVPPAELERGHFRAAERDTLLYAIAHTEMPSWLLYPLRLSAAMMGLHDSEYFAKQLERTLLRPFGLDGPNRFITLNDATRRGITDAQDSAIKRASDGAGRAPRFPRLTAADFVTVRPGRPFYIVGGTIRRYDLLAWSRTHNKRIPVEMTPLYIGTRHLFQDVGRTGRYVGGTYVEPHAYGAQRATGPAGGRADFELVTSWHGLDSSRFSLRDLMAISGGAPGEVAIAQKVAFEQMYAWSRLNGFGTKATSYDHADGGLSETLGIMPLLARRVPRIVAFVNSAEEGVPRYVKELFGEPTDDTLGWHGQAVFPRAALPRLLDAIEKKREASEPLVHVDTYTIRAGDVDANDYFGLFLDDDERYEVTVAWFFLDDAKWRAKIAERPSGKDLAKWLKCDGQFENFPHYKTFANNPLKLIDPTDAQAAALAHLTSWTVVDAETQLRSVFAQALPSTARTSTTQPSTDAARR